MNIDNYIKIAKIKINNKYIKTLILAIYSGILLSLAAIASTVASATISNYSISKIMSALVFPMGLILIIFMKTELFTGNSLMIIPMLNKDTSIKKVLRNWILVYIGNFVGSLLVAYLISKTPLVDKLGETFINITNNKISLSPTSTIILGIFCNLLVCTSVYLSTISSSITEKVLVIFIPIFIFIILSFEHSIANMFYLSIGKIIDSGISIKEIILNNLLPVTIGNVIGGSLLGTTLWYLREQK